MPPKKKNKGVVINGVSTAEMSREKLEVFALKLKEELDREREERSFFQVERDKLRTFWEVTRKQLEECQAQLRCKDRVLDVEAQKQQELLKLDNQRVKHLLYENQINLRNCKAEAMNSLRLAQDDFFEQEMEFLKVQKELKEKVRENNIVHLKDTRQNVMTHSEEVTELRDNYDFKYRELEDKFDQRLTEQRRELEFKHTMEISEVEERKNTHINMLIKHHDDLYAATKFYYNSIILNNLSLLSSLKDQVTSLKMREEHLMKQIFDLEEENKGLVGPLKEAEAKVAELSRQMQNYKKDQIALKNAKLTLESINSNFNNLMWENEVLENRFIQIKEERNDLRDNYKTALIDIQAANCMKNATMENKLTVATTTLETKETEIAALMAADVLEPEKKQEAYKKFEILVDHKNRVISKLKYELAKACKAHDDLLKTYEAKLEELGISKAELGFSPIQNIHLKGKTREGPAGLVAARH